METVIASILEVLSVSAFIFYIFRALQAKISGLESVVKVQNETLSVMDKRIEETEKVGSIYKNLMADLPSDLDNYKAIISKTKDEMIVELRNQNEIKEKKLKVAEENLTKSGGSEEVIKSSLVVLKNLITNKKGGGHNQQLDLTTISEFNNRVLEDAPALIISATTVEEYLSKQGYQIIVTEDQSIMKELFSSSEKGRKRDFDAAMATTGQDGWYALKDNELHISPEKISSLKGDFSIVKSTNP